MTSNNQKTYEGAEKLLEIWFFDENGGCPNHLDLRQMSRKEIIDILDRARCSIVKEHSNEHQLSFVLSESSLFITSNRIILKTCGNTRILESIEPLIKCANNLGFKHHRTYYSHCSFLFPEQQSKVYQDFKSETACLDRLHNFKGIEHIFGKADESRWYLYCAQSVSGDLKEPSGQTLELMMRQLSPEKMKTFYTKNSGSPELIAKRSGIQGLFPGANLADFLFEPCGYSVNGFMKADEYFTIHVTPESEFSYVSVEMNEAMEDYTNFITRVLDIFEPGSVICTFISDSDSIAHGNHEVLKKMNLPNYRMTEIYEMGFLTERKVTYVSFQFEGRRSCQSILNSDGESDSSWKTD